MATKVITEAELKSHNTEKDAWIAIHGNVYDVTKFAEDHHPGGPDIILNEAGGDATEAFEDMNHSLPARDQLKLLLVGTLEGQEVKDPIAVFKAARHKTKPTIDFNSNGDSGIMKYAYLAMTITIPIVIAALWKMSH